MPTHHGSCHCGAVQFDADTDLSKLMRCNCSLCARTGVLWAFMPASQVSVSGQENLKDYQFNKKSLHHVFCTTCGVRPFSHGKGHDDSEWYGINVGCLQDVDVNTLEYTKNDGASL